MDFKALHDKVAIKVTPEYQLLCTKARNELLVIDEAVELEQEKIVYEGIQNSQGKSEACFDFKISEKLQQKLLDAGFGVNTRCSIYRDSFRTIVKFSEYYPIHDKELRDLFKKLENNDRAYDIRCDLWSKGMIQFE